MKPSIGKNGQAICTTSGEPIAAGMHELHPVTKQQKDYLILSESERAKGFVRPVRIKYKHKKCGTETSMRVPIAETYARDPSFYSSTFCMMCERHLPVSEFVWLDNGSMVGS